MRGFQVLTAIVVLATPCGAVAQEWRASARVGRVTSDGAPAGSTASSSAVLALGRTSPRDWLGLSAAIPLNDDPFWAVLGAWKRLDTRGRAGLLLDLTGQAFLQRQHTTVAGAPAPAPGLLGFPSNAPNPLQADLSGQGVGAELMGGVFAGSSPVRLEARAGAAAQRSRLGDVSQERMLPSGDLRASYTVAPITLQAESRAWLDDGSTHAYAGGALRYTRGPVSLWGSLGRWVSGGWDRTAWSAGAGADIAPGLTLQLGGRGNTFDPVYLSGSKTSVWGGLSLRLAGSRAVSAPVPLRTHNGLAVVGLSVRDAQGRPSIAGDFTGWKPVPMQQEGPRWTYSAALEPGVYHYAFVAEDGTWFVPESVPGRQRDGMGGHTAVLVVK